MAGLGSKPGEHRGGRKKGTPNKASAARAREIAASGLTPLDFLLHVMRDESREVECRLEAGKAAAPYVHPKLANIEVSGKDGGPLQVKLVNYSPPEQLGPEAVSAAGVARTGTGLPPRRAVLAETQR